MSEHLTIEQFRAALEELGNNTQRKTHAQMLREQAILQEYFDNWEWVDGELQEKECVKKKRVSEDMQCEDTQSDLTAN